jgi:hypothetical protein
MSANDPKRTSAAFAADCDRNRWCSSLSGVPCLKVTQSD